MQLNMKISLLSKMVASFSSISLFLSFLSSLAVVSLALTNNDHSQFLYNGFNGANLNLDGIAEIHSNGLLQLTNTSNRQVGRAFFQFPVSFNTSHSFSTTFVFAMVPHFQNLGGHGLAFVVSPSTDFSHALESQYLGLLNPSNNGNSTNHLLAIEFDSISSAEFTENNDNHVGIDVNSLNSIESAPVSYFSNEERRNRTLQLISGDPIQAWIDYDDVENLLNVTVAPGGSPKPVFPLLSRSINLSDILLDTMYVGFSAATGGPVSSKHYVLGWSFNRTGEADSLKISELPQLPKENRRPRKLVLYILIVLFIVLFFLLAISGAVYFFWRKKYGEVREDWEKEFGPQRFSYKTLHKATSGFPDKELLGQGGFGKVYKGILKPSDEEIAVKRVRHEHGPGEEMKQFVSEIVSLRKLRHRNLVKLLGYSRRKGELLLVYEYLPQLSLDKFLFSDSNPLLNWPQRLHILKGIASALLYLHEQWEQVILHRDIKASNVLLDSDLNGKLADFGLARLYDHGSDGTNTQCSILVGTLGYMAPELSRTGTATKSTDVFAFGALLLEVACGRKPVEPQADPEQVFLVDWVRNCARNGEIFKTSDPKLDGDYSVEEMEMVLKLGIICSHPDPETRPRMKQVMQYLEGNVNLPDVIALTNIDINKSSLTELMIDIDETSDSTAENVVSDMLTQSCSFVHSGSVSSWSSSDSILLGGR